MESRIASSRARSAERAAKIPARLTHAAASTSRASTMMAARKGRGSAEQVTHQPGLAHANAKAIVHHRVFAGKLVRNSREGVRGGLLSRDTGLEHADNVEAVIFTFDQGAVPFDLFFVDHGDPELGPEEKLGAVSCAARHR